MEVAWSSNLKEANQQKKIPSGNEDWFYFPHSITSHRCCWSQRTRTQQKTREEEDNVNDSIRAARRRGVPAEGGRFSAEEPEKHVRTVQTWWTHKLQKLLTDNLSSYNICSCYWQSIKFSELTRWSSCPFIKTRFKQNKSVFLLRSVLLASFCDCCGHNFSSTWENMPNIFGQKCRSLQKCQKKNSGLGREANSTLWSAPSLKACQHVTAALALTLCVCD